MTWFVNPWASAGYANMLAAWTLALLVLFAGHPTRQTRALAMLLLLEGFAAAGGFGIMWSTTSPANAYGWQMIGIASGVCMIAVYPLFLSTLDTPLARPLRHPVVKAAAFLLASTMALLLLTRPLDIAADMIPVWWSPWEVLPGPWWNGFLMLIGIPSLFAFVVAFDARRRTAEGSDARRRATLYFLAFGVRDLNYGLLYFTTPFWFQRLQPASDLFVVMVLPGASLVFCVLLAYGVLRAQLFDIDVRLRWGVRRGTLAGAFVAVFFIVGTIAEGFLSNRYGFLVGGAAAGLLLFALSPLQRLAERVADATVPPSRTTPEYLAFRKLEVYKAAVESAHETGGLTDKERASLGRLREKLGLHVGDANAVEADVAARAA